MDNDLYSELKLVNFENIINTKFEDKKLLVEALTHPSYSQENNHLKNNQRLEFLGDAVLSLLINDFLYRNHVNSDEGDMSKAKAMIVSTISLAIVSKKLRINEFILLGKGEIKQNGQNKENILADVFESVLGAIYLDKGIYFAELFVKENIIKSIAEIQEIDDLQDYKTKFQELIQQSGKIKIIYETTQIVRNEFCAKVFVENILFGEGHGASSKKAEQRAAKDALAKME